ncbi:OLC1v1018007C1 [Oldenlandia corymbosa var. corymbosa]|uniref:OLC1v1018007C1 n=1 Tax=Oldenlandia corymbosa var. corymbosa TaxID=529605 RepID=A0AAV1EAW3_OLDCO|nr:OLC1v1018007C1 [Oldenlandia corymbosa var. corymbosa]
MAQKSKILIIGGTGYIGKHIVEASLKEGHPTVVLVRETTVSDPVKGKLVESFKNSGATLVYGDLKDYDSLVKAVKLVDVVISNVSHQQIPDQIKLIDAIKEAGNIKKFYPSEFGIDVDRHAAVDPAKHIFVAKIQIRRAIEAAGIPYTYIVPNGFAGYFVPTLSQPGATSPSHDKVVIYGDGNTKAVYNFEQDVGAYTIKTVDDPRTLNKIVYIRPPKNTVTFNELVGIWEKKIGKTLEKEYQPEEQLLKKIKEAPVPLNITLSIIHCIVVKGGATDIAIEPSFGVEASELYPDVKYTTVEEFFEKLA